MSPSPLWLRQRVTVSFTLVQERGRNARRRRRSAKVSGLQRHTYKAVENRKGSAKTSTSLSIRGALTTNRSFNGSVRERSTRTPSTKLSQAASSILSIRPCGVLPSRVLVCDRHLNDRTDTTSHRASAGTPPLVSSLLRRDRVPRRDESIGSFYQTSHCHQLADGSNRTLWRSGLSLAASR